MMENRTSAEVLRDLLFLSCPDATPDNRQQVVDAIEAAANRGERLRAEDISAFTTALAPPRFFAVRPASLSNADLTGANLAGANLISANLIDANLTRADLHDACLIDANLNDANLSNARLSDALLSDADLTGADLTGANLARARLSNARLTDANLSNADLTSAHLSGARLARARLSNARLTDANLSNADLTGADLTGARLHPAPLTAVSSLATRMDYPARFAMARWSDETRWPDDLYAIFLVASDELEPGVYRVRPPDGSRDRHDAGTPTAPLR